MTDNFKTRLIVFDKDGTLTKPVTNNQFSETPQDQELIFEFPKLLTASNVVAIATNQKGISDRYKTKEFLEAEIQFLREELDFKFHFCVACPDGGETLWSLEVPSLRIPKDPRVNFCWGNERFVDVRDEDYGVDPSLTGKFRKPLPGMLEALVQIAEYNEKKLNELSPNPDKTPWRISEKVFIGNAESDKQAAKAAGFKYWDVYDWIEINGFKKY